MSEIKTIPRRSDAVTAAKILKDYCKRSKNCTRCPLLGTCSDAPSDWKIRGDEI